MNILHSLLALLASSLRHANPNFLNNFALDLMSPLQFLRNFLLRQDLKIVQKLKN